MSQFAVYHPEMANLTYYADPELYPLGGGGGRVDFPSNEIFLDIYVRTFWFLGLRLHLHMGSDRGMFRTFKLKDADVTIVVWCYQGSDLKLGATESDYRVTIGDDECPIAVVTSQVLRCRPTLPRKLSDSEPQRPVTVSVRGVHAS